MSLRRSIRRSLAWFAMPPCVGLLAAALALTSLAGADLRADQPAAGASAEQNANQWVETGREALNSRLAPVPWYDATTDGVRPIDLPKKSRTDEPAPEHPSEAPAWVGATLEALAYCLLAALLLALAWNLARAFLQREAPLGNAPRRTARMGAADRVDVLAFAPHAPAEDLLAVAGGRYDQGDYSQAIIYLYAHLLAELDRRQRIRLDRGKTNRQYLRELVGQPALRTLLGDTIDCFERVAFGGERLNRVEFESCWRRLPQLDLLLAEAPV